MKANEHSPFWTFVNHLAHLDEAAANRTRLQLVARITPVSTWADRNVEEVKINHSPDADKLNLEIPDKNEGIMAARHGIEP
jgi:hypothetical protein